MNRLRKVRRDRKLTQDELSARSGVDQTTISSLEVGVNKSPSWEVGHRLALALMAKPLDVFPVNKEWE